MYILSLIYGFLIGLRNYMYDKKILKIKKIENLEIFCVGNITVGGTGKTPAVQYFAKKSCEEGIKTVIVSRGYGGVRDEEPLIVSNGAEIFCSYIESGDESYLHALNTTVPVIVSKDRYQGAKLAKEKFGAKRVILDDGYQHRKLYRDKNIVLIDASNPFGGKKLLPLGRLRENLKELKRADEFIITKSDIVSEEQLKNIKDELKKQEKPIKRAVHSNESFYSAKKEKYSLDTIKDKKLLLFSGLANPENFEKSIKKLEPLDIQRKDYTDHYKFKKSDIDELKRTAEKLGSDYIVCTEKDYVKIEKMIEDIENILVLKIEFKILEDC